MAASEAVSRRVMKRWVRALSAFCALAAIFAPAASAMTNQDNTPFPASRVITGAVWESARHGPPSNQFGDILPVTWADDGQLYVLIDDGGTNPPKANQLWRNSLAQITGAPLQNLRFQRVGGGPPPATWSQIHHNRSLWSGPLGPYYSTGLTSVNHTFYATQVNNWNWQANGPFKGLAGIAYSSDHGNHWTFPKKSFPGPTGNLNWVQNGRDLDSPDGYNYSISTEREFNASTLFLGRSQGSPGAMTDPSHWQWAAGWEATPTPWPQWSSQISAAQPILSWSGHITYPRMSYDPGLHRYLLTFTYSYAGTPPGVWRNGAELVILDAPHPWGPFTFVARQPYFGPSNGYDPEFPVKWVSSNGQDLWLIWAANFDGCARGLSCAAAYGFNYQRIHLNIATGVAGSSERRARAGSTQTAPPRPPRSWRALPATPPPVPLPRLHLPG
jgi:hypothetical protein